MSYFFLVGTTLTTQQYVLAWKQWQEKATTELHQKIPSSPLSHCALPRKKSKLPEFPHSKSEYLKKNFTLVFSTVVFVQGLRRGKTGRQCENPSKIIFPFQLWNNLHCVSRNLIDVAEVFFKSKFNIVHLQCWLGTPKNKPLWIFLWWHWYLCIIGRWKAFNFFWNYFLVINPAFKAKKITQMLL